MAMRCVACGGEVGVLDPSPPCVCCDGPAWLVFDQGFDQGFGGEIASTELVQEVLGDPELGTPAE